ncbi:glutaredoxin 2 [Neisseria leonii]|uniref:Glutaredoxin 2 n=1 Tax=Neisseria leonii TaxID=2995413 RepID=A0A9X4ICT5_9NEIS|nr:glutaredoxin 2 [Neisseria sp. 51.81]MDD9326966.1 glutaredoxin 2 [Neisseria sp. 51.81]
MKLYTYDHCPFCVRARMIFGLHRLEFEEVVLANDDEATPVAMIGAKQVPVLEKTDGSYLAESLDIVRYIDHLGGRPLLDETVRPEVSDWIARTADTVRRLLHPRAVLIGLPEFATQSAADYFTRKKEAAIGSFADNLAQSETLLAQLHGDLADLAELAVSEQAFGGRLGLEDILIFPLLRNLTMVRSLQLPPKLAAYTEKMSAETAVPLYTDQAV